MNRELPNTLDIELRHRVQAHVDLTTLTDEQLAYALWYGLRQIMIDRRHFAGRDPTFNTLAQSMGKGA
jgi:hypothetical protein